MKFDIVVGNPIIRKQENGRFHVVYAAPPAWKIEEHINLTYEEALTLPYVEESMLLCLK